ncbi:hypothetical protein SEA_BOOPY_185 [Gordonia phage Boopy]|nr:hypothetical protein SEA_BOOPY_185 [Gordonia phage Boopy]UXE04294.1 hypothetical protein SEA_BLUENGOLD_181 [Gordonia phage BlueNGold]WBF03935.1 hypothetical protein SEA_MAREELIH_182 [Gordonia phage Mareelih]
MAEYEDRFEATNDEVYERHGELAPNQPAANMCLAQFKYERGNDTEQWHVCTRVTKHDGDHVCHAGVCGADVSRPDHVKQMINSKDYHPDAVYGREYVLQQDVITATSRANKAQQDLDEKTEELSTLSNAFTEMKAELHEARSQLAFAQVSGSYIVAELAKALDYDLSDTTTDREELLPKVLRILRAYRGAEDESSKHDDHVHVHYDKDTGKTATCDAIYPRSIGRTCELTRGHAGDHADYGSQGDSAVFWNEKTTNGKRTSKPAPDVDITGVIKELSKFADMLEEFKVLKRYL